jgi:hypothetical protein
MIMVRTLGRHRDGCFALRRHDPVVRSDVAQHHFSRFGGMGFNHPHHGLMVAVPVQVVRGDAGAVGQYHRPAGQLEQGRPDRHLTAVPAAQSGIVRVVEDRGRAPASGQGVTQAVQRSPPDPFGDPAGNRVGQPDGKGLLEQLAEEARVNRPPGEHRVPGRRRVGGIPGVEDENRLQTVRPDGNLAFRFP